MAARVVYSAAALADLERVVEYPLERSAGAASEALEQIRSAVELLGDHPRIGRRVRGHPRELVIGYGASGYIALYRFDASHSSVRILRLRHQREAGYRD